MAVTLDWSTATVSDSELTIELQGELSKEWKHSFRTTAKLLGAAAIELHKGVVQVAGVRSGEEREIRHHLEALIDQANAAQEQREASESEDKSEQHGPDAELTERFRAFAETEPGGEPAD